VRARQVEDDVQTSLEEMAFMDGILKKQDQADVKFLAFKLATKILN
jgi:hypothetical protein